MEKASLMDAIFRPQRSLPIRQKQQTPLSPVQQSVATPQAMGAETLQRAQENPASLAPGDVQALQRSIGNRAVSQMIGRNSATPPVQAKMQVGASNDRYEQEANRVARQVVGQLHGARPISAQPATASVQRARSGSYQGGAFAQGGELSPQIAGQLQGARGGGQPLAAPVRSAMEQAFGADFSRVRVHQSQKADTLNRAISARAFTSGQDLFFRKGEYDPSSLAGQGLLAHELTHVVQQSGGQLQRAPARSEDADGLAPQARFPSAYQVAQSGHTLGQRPQIAQRSPQGRIHRCGDDEPKTTTTTPPVSIKPSTGPTKSTPKSTGSKPVDVKKDFGTESTTEVAPPLPSVHSGRDTGPAITAVNSSSLSEDYKKRALVMINNPNEASQGGYGICGLTTVLRALLIHDPVRFVNLAVAAMADVGLATQWREFFQKNADEKQKKKELDYITAQYMLRKGGSGQVSQTVLKRNTSGGVDETTKTKDYGDVFKNQTTFSNTFKIDDWEGKGHYATTAGGLNYLHSHVSGRQGFKIKISDNFQADYDLAKAKAGPTGTVNASIKGHDFYQAKGAPVSKGPAEKHPAKYRHWVTIESLEKIAKENKSSGKSENFFKMKIWTYEKYFDAVVNENVVGDYIHSLVVM